MRYFGDATGSPFYEQLPRAEPSEVVGKRCDECAKELTESDAVVLSDDELFHRQCFAVACAKAGIV